MSRSKPGGRVPRPVRRMGSEVIDDRRTRRVRDRGAADRAEIEAELESMSDPDAILGEDEDDEGD